ncbi:MAG: ribbon-helix-helix protein, CopG family [Acidobacteriota bacterium]|nr:MAG: ribbon-helix-helix protein, CopG family [Acidobacteriota bacterium]
MPEQMKSKKDGGTRKDSRPAKEERVKMTIYLPKEVTKEFKKLAIDLEKDYSELAERAFREIIAKHV